MSEKPNEDGIVEILKLSRRAAELCEALSVQRAIIKKATAEVEAAQDELRQVYYQRQAHMQRMDLTSSGNAGYEQRMAYFLTELVRQADHD